MNTEKSFTDSADNTHFTSTDYETVRYVVMFVPECGVVSMVQDCSAMHRSIRTDWSITDPDGKTHTRTFLG